MLWPVTLLGGLAGWFLAGFSGALLGALLGQVCDRRLQLSWKTLGGRLSGRPALRGDELLFVLLGRLAKASGRVTEAHIQAARAEMQRRYLDTAQQRAAIQAFGRGKAGRDDLQLALQALLGHTDEIKALLQSCWRVARANGEPDDESCRLIVQWGQWLGWTEEATSRLDAARRPDAPRRTAYQEALRVLGVGVDADAKEVKLAYRRLLSLYHPDKLEGSGGSAAALREATERTRELHNAYALVQQHRERH